MPSPTAGSCSGWAAAISPTSSSASARSWQNSVGKLSEFMEMLELAFTRDTFSYSGKHYRLPETHIASRPVKGLPEIWVAGDNPVLHQLAARKGWTVMLTPRHATVPQLLEARQRLAGVYSSQGLDARRVAIAPLRHVCITDSKAEAASFIDNARHQIRLSQSLRHREELIDGTMLVEKTYKGEPPIEELARAHPRRRRRDGGRAPDRADPRRAPPPHAPALPGRRLLAEDGAEVDRAVRHARAADDREGARAAR